MPDSHLLEARYPCPVCLGLPMEKLSFQNPPLVLDTCSRCGGMWFDYGEVNQLKHLHPQMALKKVAMREQDYMMQCHQCQHPMRRNLDQCSSCGWKNRLDCPVCQKQMSVVNKDGLKLDVCKSCKGVWFDNHELVQIWNGALDRMKKNYQGRYTDVGDDALYLFLDVLTYSPDLAFYTADAAVNLITHTPDLAAAAVEAVAHAPDLAASAFEAVANAPEVAGAVVEGVANVAGGIFEVIGAILGGIFDL